LGKHTEHCEKLIRIVLYVRPLEKGKNLRWLAKGSNKKQKQVKHEKGGLVQRIPTSFLLIIKPNVNTS
jgi:hypothetical protein